MSGWIRFASAMDVITGFLCTLFGLALGLIILLLCSDIVLRNAGITSLPWVIELTEYVLYGGTFLAAPCVLRKAVMCVSKFCSKCCHENQRASSIWSRTSAASACLR